MSAVQCHGTVPDRKKRAAPAPRLGVVASVVLLIAAFAVLRGDSSRLAATEPPPSLTGSSPLPLEVAYRWDGLLRSGDVTAAAELFASSPGRVVLPGLPLTFLPEGAGHDEIAAALAFFVEHFATDMSGCRVDDPAPKSLTAAPTRVVCDVHIASTPFAEVALIAGRTVPLVFWVNEDGLITGLLRGITGTPMLLSYCYWVESIGAAPAVIDSRCSPIASAESAAAHTALVARYLEADRPGPGRAYFSERMGAGALEQMIERHNRGLAGWTWTWPDAPATGFPGLLGDGAPTLREYLDWSRIAYRIDLGPCFVDGTAGPRRFELSCPDATWAGPLVDGLSLDPPTQPVTFRVEQSAVRAAEGTTDEALVHGFGRFCGWVRDHRPEAAPFIFADGCTPVYSAEAAGNLLMVLSAYIDDPR